MTSDGAGDSAARYRAMARIRRFEEQVRVLYRDGVVPGFVHLSIGQEAVAVGACAMLRPSDVIVSTHRGHGHCLAKGADMTAMFAELMARDTGTNRGRGGSMHIADPGIGIFGANGIVGAGLPIAVGAATVAKQRGAGDVVVAFFGDGAIASGAFHESINLAALWKLPILFLCENNQLAEFSSVATQHPVPPQQRAAGYGVPSAQVDGNDVDAVVDAVEPVLAALRSGNGPFFLEAVTYRVPGHYEGDPQRYRQADQTSDAGGPDPLAVMAARLDAGLVAGIEEDVAVEVAEAVRVARTGPPPDVDSLLDFVIRDRVAPAPEVPVIEGDEFRTMDAIQEALAHELAGGGDVLIAGIDVAGGNVFGLTRGLAERFPGRVLDTPISETAVIGLAVGAAMAGATPVVELMYLDFLGVCFDQLLNQAAKLPFMTGGKARMGMVVRTQFGAGRSSGSQHSQSLEAMLAHVPGLTVVMPSTPADTYGLLRAAIADPNPVVFIENRLLYGAKGPRPPADHLVPLGRAAVRRTGRHATAVSWSRMCHDVLAAADLLAAEGIEIEVIDLRTVQPWDADTVSASVHATGRLAVIHEAVLHAGLGAEIAATITERNFFDLDAPVRRIGGPFSPVPYAPELESAWLPSVASITAALRDLVGS